MATNRDTINLPILPINTVLFPGNHVTIPALESHRLLIESAQHSDTNFATALFRTVSDNSSIQEPMPIATVARIIDAPQNSEENSVRIMGISRVSLLSYRHVGASLVGQFRFMPDIEDPIPTPLNDEARALGSELWGMVTAHHSHPHLPESAETLSYWIASHLPIAPSDQQELLEIRSTRARLAKEISFLRNLLDTYRSTQSG